MTIVEGRDGRLPTYRLERIHVSVLNVDYAPPHGNGYARPLSQVRLRQLRREWDPLAVSPLTLSKREDSTLWVIDGNHRRVVAFESGMLNLPAMVHTGLTRQLEADLYTKLGTVLGQTPWTRFQAKLVAGDEDARTIVDIARRYNLEINGNYSNANGKIQAIARVESIYGRGGPDALHWTLDLLTAAFGTEREALNELQLEGVFGFYIRYRERVRRDEVAAMLGGAGLTAWIDRAESIWGSVDVGRRANTYGMAIVNMINDGWRRQGVKVKDLLPAWVINPSPFVPYRDVPYRVGHSNWTTSSPNNPAPQQLERVS